MTANKTLNTAISVVNAAVGKNRIINGDFNIWQRGTSFSVTGSVNDYSADRWRTEGFTTNSTISRQAFTGGQTAVPDNPTYYCTVALTTTNTGGYWAFGQRIESPQVMRAYGTYTLSFWVRATTGTVVAGGWYYGINGPVSGPALTTTWQKVTQTVTLSSAASESAGYVTAYLVYLPQNTAAVSIDVAHVQLEAGSAPSSFETRTYGQELILCQRYLPCYIASASSEAIGPGYAANGTIARGMVPFNVQARVAPTGVTISSIGDFGFSCNINMPATSAAGFYSATPYAGWFTLTGAGTMTSLAGGYLYAVNTNAKILWTGCEL